MSISTINIKPGNASSLNIRPGEVSSIQFTGTHTLADDRRYGLHKFGSIKYGSTVYSSSGQQFSQVNTMEVK